MNLRKLDPTNVELKKLNELLLTKLISLKMIKGELVARILNGQIKCEMMGYLKNKEAEIVPVPKQALTYLEEIWPKDDQKNFVVFELPFRLKVSKPETKELKYPKDKSSKTKVSSKAVALPPAAARELKKSFNRKFGEELAEKICLYLTQYKSINYGHRDYCGMGFELKPSGEVLYGFFDDGYLSKTKKSFEDLKKFKKWLAIQTDASLSNSDEKDGFFHNNQTITFERLSDLLK